MEITGHRCPNLPKPLRRKGKVWNSLSEAPVCRVVTRSGRGISDIRGSGRGQIGTNFFIFCESWLSNTSCLLLVGLGREDMGALTVGLKVSA